MEIKEDLKNYDGTLELLESMGLAGSSTAAMDAEQHKEFMVT